MSHDAESRTELTETLHRSTASYEIAFAPVLMALLGLWLDRTVGTAPIFTIVFAVVGLSGAVVKAYYTYGREMAALRERAPWQRSQGEGS
jgi:F0F1-type ATP synthase assembly protein I